MQDFFLWLVTPSFSNLLKKILYPSNSGNFHMWISYNKKQ